MGFLRRRLRLAIAVIVLIAAAAGATTTAGLHGRGPLAGRVHSAWPFLGAGPSPAASPRGATAGPEAATGRGPGAGAASGVGVGPAAGAQGAPPAGARESAPPPPGEALTGGTAGVGGSPGPGQPHLTGPCIPSVQTDRASYPRGTVIQMGVVITNASTTPCSIAGGPGAPTFYVADAAGHQVWGGCDSPTGQPVPCSGGITAQPLAPNGVFTSSKTWNQTRPAAPGAAPTQVPAGKYSVGYGKPGTAYTSIITIT